MKKSGSIWYLQSLLVLLSMVLNTEAKIQDFDLIKSFELGKGQITGLGRIEGYPGEPEEAYRFDRGLARLHLGPEFVSDLAEASRESKSLTITSNLKLDRKSYGTLLSIETEGEGNLVFSLLFSCFSSCRISLYYPEGSLTSVTYFDKVPNISDGKWHKMVLHIQTNRMGKHVVSLFMDCRSLGKKKISAGLDQLFPLSNEKVKYALRFAQRGASNSVYIPWKGSLQSVLLIFGVRSHSFANPVDCLTKSTRQILSGLTNKNNRHKYQPTVKVVTTQRRQTTSKDATTVKSTPTKPQKDGTTKPQPSVRPITQKEKPTRNIVDIITSGETRFGVADGSSPTTELVLTTSDEKLDYLVDMIRQLKKEQFHRESALRKTIEMLRIDLNSQSQEVRYVRSFLEHGGACKSGSLIQQTGKRFDSIGTILPGRKTDRQNPVAGGKCLQKPCFPFVECYETPDEGLGFRCGPCPPGFTGNGIRCEDVNECNLYPCSALTKCINLRPGYQCTPCPVGYLGNASMGLGVEMARKNKQVRTRVDKLSYYPTMKSNSIIPIGISVDKEPHSQLGFQDGSLQGYLQLLQRKTKEGLQCPANTKRKDGSVGYTSFASNILEFKSISGVPKWLNLSLLDEGLGIEETLRQRNASWHKTCRDIFNNTKLERAKKRKLSGQPDANEDDTQIESDGGVCIPLKTRRSSATLSSKALYYYCFFCDKEDNPINLHSFSTFEVNKKVESCIDAVNDNKLKAKLNTCGDLMAAEAKYHTKCLVRLYNRAQQTAKVQLQNDAERPPIELEELAFAELFAYIDESLESEDLPVLKLSNLVKYFSLKLHELGVKCDNKINSTRLKDRILETYSDLTAHYEGREVLL
ncbi:uncharacterized protein LOC116309020, partial [Actinia tenebrosa]|uniref:Uncharacterized protein LOC116309020 n=1 Tax=Actinia tenebrosa TaxID=6105 RepID=A0A6P8J5K0_ACTTE